MAYTWFKFYGGEFLADPKTMLLTASERSCWVTLLCFSSTSTMHGVIPFASEEQVMLASGVTPNSEEWQKTIGVLKKFQKLGMITHDNDTITIMNWAKRQQTSLTGYERVKRHRDKKKKDNVEITSEENRIEENRIEERKNTPAKQSRSFFSIREQYDLVRSELIQKIPEKLVDSELEKFLLYWTEPNKSGTKVRWEQQNTFDVRRRLVTWFGRIKDQQRLQINRGRGIAE